MIYYLAQAYSSVDHQQAFDDACRWKTFIEQMGHVCFSPIAESHPYEVWRQVPQPIYIPQPDYVARDLAICAAMLQRIKPKCPLCKMDWNVECLCSGGDVWTCHSCKPTETWNEKDLIWEQPNLTMLFAPTCFRDLSVEAVPIELAITIPGSVQPQYCFWVSKGAKAEYDWAKAHHVKCLLLNEFLAGREVAL